MAKEAMNNRVERITIVGGGTAGWLTALFLNNYLNRFRQGQPVAITLIESPNVPTVGVGEATIISLPKLMQQMAIDEAEMFRRCNASFKLSVRFCDWSFDGAGRPLTFFHPFNRPSAIGAFSPAYHYLKFGPPLPGMSLVESVIPNVGLVHALKGPRALNAQNYDRTIDYAYHLDAALYAGFMRDTATSRGVEHIRDDVDDVFLDENGAVSALQLREAGRYAVEFIIDCTGFKNLIMERLRTAPFISLNDHLLNDRAIPVQIPHRDPKKIEPCTRATALGAGWVWRVPLYSRVGTGYVFSSAFRSDDEARAEFFSHLRAIGDLPAEAPDPNTHVIKMRVGYTNQSWVKNCVSIGLSGGFIEPLEATAIYTIELAARWFVAHFPDRTASPALASRYNALMTGLYEEIRDFIQMHYYTSNRSEPYWVAAREAPLPDTLRERLELWRVRLPDDTDSRPNSLFKYWNYTVVMQPKGFFKGLRFPLDGSLSRDHWDKFGRDLEAYKRELMRVLPDHYELLTDIRSYKPVTASAPRKTLA